MNRFQLVQVRTANEAVRQLTQEVRPKGAGTDWIALMKEGLAAPKKLVNLSGIEELRGIRLNGETIVIGASTTLAEIASNKTLRQFGGSALATAAGDAATPQVRNLATLGGNLCQRPRCWYFRSPDFTCRKKGGKDCPAIEGEHQYHALFDNKHCAATHPSNLGPALVVLDAKLNILGPAGPRVMPIEQFFDVGERVDIENSLAPDEIIVSVEIDGSGHRGRSISAEVRERQSFDWPLASVAIAERQGGIRVAFGAVAPRPWRIKGVEAALTRGNLKQAQDLIARQANALSKNRYKIALLQTLLERCWEKMH